MTVPTYFNDLKKREIDEIVPGGGSTRIPKVQSPFGGYPKVKAQERKGEKGDNMRYLYIVVTKPWSVHCGDDATWDYDMSVHRGDVAALRVPT